MYITPFWTNFPDFVLGGNFGNLTQISNLNSLRLDNNKDYVLSDHTINKLMDGLVYESRIDEQERDYQKLTDISDFIDSGLSYNGREITKLGESIPVVDKKGKIIGVFSENDLFVSYLEAEEFRADVETKS